MANLQKYWYCRRMGIVIVDVFGVSSIGKVSIAISIIIPVVVVFIIIASLLILIIT